MEEEINEFVSKIYHVSYKFHLYFEECTVELQKLQYDSEKLKVSHYLQTSLDNQKPTV